MLTKEQLNDSGSRSLSAHLGIEVTSVSVGELRAELPITPVIGAPEGHIHAGTVVAFAVDAASCGSKANLPKGATGFATIELKCNYLSSPNAGTAVAVARAVHMGGTTQIWDVEVFEKTSLKKIALFRCTQMMLYPRAV
jgi:1,4-dihydroxy-2-naphthoyl-CoA hydrolase